MVRKCSRPDAHQAKVVGQYHGASGARLRSPWMTGFTVKQSQQRLRMDEAVWSLRCVRPAHGLLGDPTGTFGITPEVVHVGQHGEAGDGEFLDVAPRQIDPPYRVREA